MTALLFSLASVMFTICPISWHVGGRYDADNNRVVVCKNFEETGEYVLNHELSHWFYANYLNDAERDQWHEVNKGKWYPTKYAMTNDKEGWAEVGRTYLQGASVCSKGRIKRCNTKLKFVQKMFEKYLTTKK